MNRTIKIILIITGVLLVTVFLIGLQGAFEIRDSYRAGDQSQGYSDSIKTKKYAFVFNQEGSTANLWEDINFSKIVTTLPNGTEVLIISGPKKVNGVDIFKVSREGKTGWISGRLLRAN